MSRAGVLSAMVRLLICTVNNAAQRGGPDAGPNHERSSLLAALITGLNRFASRGPPQLVEAIATTPALVTHCVYLLDALITDTTKASIVTMLHSFISHENPALRGAIMSKTVKLGPVLVVLFSQIGPHSAEGLVKRTAAALSILAQRGHSLFFFLDCHLMRHQSTDSSLSPQMRVRGNC